MEIDGVNLTLENLGQDLLQLVVGEKWPNGDENAMRRLAAEWRDAAAELEQVREDATQAVRGIGQYLQGQNGDAFQSFWDSTFDDGGSGGGSGTAPAALPFAVKFCRAMADSLEKGATQIETTKETIMGKIATLVATVTPQIAAGLTDFGTTDATAVAEITAGRGTIQALLQAAGELMTQTVEEAIKLGLPQAELNFAIQFKEAGEGHASGVGWGATLQSAPSGAKGAALAAEATTGVTAGGPTAGTAGLSETGKIPAPDFASGSLAALAAAHGDHEGVPAGATVAPDRPEDVTQAARVRLMLRGETPPDSARAAVTDAGTPARSPSVASAPEATARLSSTAPDSGAHLSGISDSSQPAPAAARAARPRTPPQADGPSGATARLDEATLAGEGASESADGAGHDISAPGPKGRVDRAGGPEPETPPASAGTQSPAHRVLDPGGLNRKAPRPGATVPSPVPEAPPAASPAPPARDVPGRQLDQGSAPDGIVPLPAPVPPSRAGAARAKPLGPPESYGTRNAAGYREFRDHAEAANYGAALARTYGDLPPAQVEAIQSYAGEAGKAINRALRTGHEGPADVKQWTAGLDEVMTTHRVPENLTAAREVSLRAFKGMNPEKLRGVTLHDAGFLSAALGPDATYSGSEDDVVLHLEIPAGTRGLYIAEIADKRGERELLLDRGTGCTITGSRWDPAAKRWRIRGRAVQQPETREP